MKTKYHRFLLAAVAVLFFAACAKQEPGKTDDPSGPDSGQALVPMTFQATNTRTVLGPSDVVLWESGDHISIFDGDDNRDFSTSGSGASASFSGSAIESATYYALYPYDASASLSEGVISLILPQQQKGVAGSFGSGVNYSVAKTSDNSLMMRNLGGLIAFSISASNITSVTLRGNNNERLAGPSTVTFDGEGIPTLASTGSGDQHGSLILTPQSGSTFAPGYYYFFVPALSFSSGVTLVFARNDDARTAECVVGSSFSVGRSRIADLGSIDTDTLNWELALRLVFTDHISQTDGFIWPFVESKPSHPADWADGNPHTITMTDGSYALSVFASNNATLISSSGQGFKFGNSSEDYLRLPVPSGYSLRKITLVSGNYNGSNVVTVRIVNASTGDQFGSSWTNSTKGAVHSWELNDDSGATWQIMHDDTHNCSIHRLTLYYSPLVGVGSVTTAAASNIYSATGTSATLNGSFTATPFDAADYTCGFDYKTGAGAWTTVNCGTTALSFSYNLSGLTADTEYSFRAWAMSNSDMIKVYGGVQSFTPSNQIVLNLNFDKNAGGGNIWELAVNTADVEKLSELTKVYDGYTWECHSYHADGYGIRYRTSGDYSGLCLNHQSTAESVNSWIKMPAIPSFKLTRLALKAMDSSSNYNVSSAVDGSGAGNEAILVTQSIGARVDKAHNLAGTAANTHYYLCSTKPKMCYLYITLTYSFVSE